MISFHHSIVCLLSDHLGGVSADGTAAQTQGYYPWGETRFGSLETEYQFTGQYRLAALGLDYFNARWYDSALGRFAQADSIVPLASQGVQALDRYTYANNNPLRYNDPTGHILDDGCNTQGCTQENPSQSVWAIEKVLAGKQTPWGQLTGDYKGILGQAGWKEISYDFEFVTGNAAHINGKLQDPAVWALVFSGGTRLGIKYGAKLIDRLLGPGIGFGPGFSSSEKQSVLDLVRSLGLDFRGFKFWRGEGAPVNYFASAEPGAKNITFYDSFFTATLEQQLLILQEEFIHSFQLIVEYTDDAIRAAEAAAKR